MCLLAHEPLGEFLHCLCPVAYLVFHFLSEFREALVVAVWNEDRIITEAFRTMLLMRYTTFHGTLEAVFA